MSHPSLQVMWDDLIGEPEGVQSVDCAWNCSKSCFQVREMLLHDHHVLLGHLILLLHLAYRALCPHLCILRWIELCVHDIHARMGIWTLPPRY